MKTIFDSERSSLEEIAVQLGRIANILNDQLAGVVTELHKIHYDVVTELHEVHLDLDYLAKLVRESQQAKDKADRAP